MREVTLEVRQQLLTGVALQVGGCNTGAQRTTFTEVRMLMRRERLVELFELLQLDRERPLGRQRRVDALLLVADLIQVTLYFQGCR